MSPFPVLLLLFLLVPLLEIYFLIVVGGWIGPLPTVLLVVLTAVVGAALARALAERTPVRLALLGRTELPEDAPESWEPMPADQHVTRVLRPEDIAIRRGRGGKRILHDDAR